MLLYAINQIKDWTDINFKVVDYLSYVFFNYRQSLHSLLREHSNTDFMSRDRRYLIYLPK